jgi:hypothetical protein
MHVIVTCNIKGVIKSLYNLKKNRLKIIELEGISV